VVHPARGTAAGQLPLAAILVLTSVISAGYYLPVIMAMYMQPEPFEQAHAGMRIGRWGGAAWRFVAGLLPARHSPESPARPGKDER